MKNLSLIKKRKIKFLVGDIGNTFIKISLLNYKLKILKSYTIETSEIYKKKKLISFTSKIFVKNLDKKILFSSVVPSSFKIFKSYFKKNGYKLFEIKDLKINKIIKLKVDNYRQVGSDRIANAIGSYYMHKKNCLVIDFGTATTFDVIKKPGIYDGGVIAPGVKSSINKLNELTALLPLIDLKSTTRTYGKNTNDALNSGFLWGYQGLINNIIKKIISSGKIKYKVILTGGYANLFKHLIINKPLIDQNITIKGVIKVYKDLIL